MAPKHHVPVAVGVNVVDVAVAGVDDDVSATVVWVNVAVEGVHTCVLVNGPHRYTSTVPFGAATPVSGGVPATVTVSCALPFGPMVTDPDATVEVLVDTGVTVKHSEDSVFVDAVLSFEAAYVVLPPYTAEKQ